MTKRHAEERLANHLNIVAFGSFLAELLPRRIHVIRFEEEVEERCRYLGRSRGVFVSSCHRFVLFSFAGRVSCESQIKTQRTPLRAALALTNHRDADTRRTHT